MKARARISFVLLFLLSTTFLSAQETSIKDVTEHKYALNNLVTGIKSENNGLKRSSIYYAGKYRIAEATPVLVEELNKENTTEIKCLIALCLYRIGNAEGMAAVKEISKSSCCEKVKSFCTQVYLTYQMENDIIEKFIVNN